MRVRWVWRDRLNGRPPTTKEGVVLALFQAATVFHLGNGQSTFFWTDRWLNRSSIQTLAPNVFQTVKARKRKATVVEALHEFAWVRHIQGAITMQLLVEFAGLCDMLDQVHLSTEPDTFLWGLTANNGYSATSAYGTMFFGSSALLGAKQLWKTSAPRRVRCTVAAGQGTGGTGMACRTPMTVCDQAPKMMDHILLGCVFSRQVWHICLLKLQLQVIVVAQENTMQWWLRSRKLVQRYFDMASTRSSS